MLPKLNGFEILSTIKNNHIDSQVIMLTAKTSLDDKLEGFGGGADDYLTKPFHLEELLARKMLKKQKNINSIYLILLKI